MSVPEAVTPRVVFLNQFYPPHNVATAHLCASLTSHLATAGFRVTMLTSALEGDGAETSAEAAIDSTALDVRRIASLRVGKPGVFGRVAQQLRFYVACAFALARLPRQDAIVCLTSPPFIVALAALARARHGGTRLILWNMDCYPEVAERFGVIRERGLAARALRGVNRFAFARVDRIVCLDEAMRSLLLSSYALDANRLTVLPNWESASLATSPSRAGRSEGEIVPERTGRRRVRVLYLGNLGAGHAIEPVLEAASRLADLPLEFLFVGGGIRVPELLAGASARGLDNVLVRAQVPKTDTPALLASADAALITLRPEMAGVMSPSKLHANLAAGLPVIYVGPEGSNVDEAIVAHGCGISVRNHDVDSLVSAFRTLVEAPERTERWSAAAHEAFSAHYSDDAVLPRFEALLRAELGMPEPIG